LAKKMTGMGDSSAQRTLTALVRTRLKRMHYGAGLLYGFLAKTGLDIDNPHH
jgi:hypothetical protein